VDFPHEFYDAAVLRGSGHVGVTFLSPSIIPQTCRRPILLGGSELENVAGGSRAAGKADEQVLSQVGGWAWVL
jgi:hypothetical protein